MAPERKGENAFLPKLVEKFKEQGKNLTFSMYFPKDINRQGLMTIDGYDLKKYSTSDKLDWLSLSNTSHWTVDASSV